MKRRSDSAFTSVKSGAFTLIEVLVVIGVLGILAAILFPVFASARERGRRTACLSNLRQIDAALNIYTQDYEGMFPPGMVKGDADWVAATYPYVSSDAVYRCPTGPIPPGAEVPADAPRSHIPRGYETNSALCGTYQFEHADNPSSQDAQVRFPSSTVALCEFAFRIGDSGNDIIMMDGGGSPDMGTDLEPGQQLFGPAGALRHNGGSNYAFVDGHAKWYLPTQVSSGDQTNDGTHPSFAL